MDIAELKKGEYLRLKDSIPEQEKFLKACNNNYKVKNLERFIQAQKKRFDSLRPLYEV